MSDREKSYLSFGLAALALVCATLLRALGAVEPSFLMYVFGLAFSAIGWYHAPAPTGGGKMPPPGAAALLLALLGLGQAGCGPVVVVELDELLGRLGRGLGLRAAGDGPAAQSVSITPITNLSGGASGFQYSGASYIVSCSVSGSVTLYPVVYDGTAWEPPFTSYGCALSSTIAPSGSCWFPARQGTGLTWNAYQTGTGSVSGCTAIGSATPVPASRSASSGGGGGTVTSIECLAGLTCTPDPIVGAGTIAPDFGTAAGQVVQGGVVTGASCAYPSTLTYNAAGQVTACTAGSAPAVTGLADPSAQVGLTVIPGVATTAMRSDAAPALNQGIAPTWTGAHTFSLAVTANTSVLTPLLDRATAGTLTLGGTATTVQLAAGVSLSGAAGGGGLALGSLTGNWDLPQGNGTWAGAFNKYLSLSTTGASGTIYLGADAPVTISSANEIRLQSSGANRLYIGSAVTLAAGISLSGAAGAGGLSLGSMTGDTTLPTGSVSWSGASGKNLTLSGSGSALIAINGGTSGVVIQRGGAILLDIGSLSSTAVTLRAGISLSASTGAGGLALSNMTGNTELPTGNVSWTGATNKTLSLTAQGSSGTMLLRTTGSGAHLTLQTSGVSAYVIADGTTGVVMRRGGTTQFDVGNTSSSAVTLGANVSLNGAAGSGGLSLGSMTGDTTLPTGAVSWTGAANKGITLTAGSGASAAIESDNAVRLRFSGSTWLFLNSTGVIVRPEVTPPAGGSTSARLLFGDVSGFGIYYGTGAPTVSAAKGSLYLRTDGSGTSDRMYVNTDGSTGWTAVTTAT